MRRCQLTHINLTGLLDQAWDILILASASCSSRPASFRTRRGVTLWVRRPNSRSDTHISQNPATGPGQLSGLLTRRPFSDTAARAYSDARSDYLACPWRATVLAVSVGRPDDELRRSINHACAARAPRARIAGQRSASSGSGLSLGGHRGSLASPATSFGGRSQYLGTGALTAAHIAAGSRRPHARACSAVWTTRPLRLHS
jgi:hypothetical protein